MFETFDFMAVSGDVPEFLCCGVKKEVGEHLAHTHTSRPRWVVLQLISKHKDTRYLNKDSLQGIFGKHGGEKKSLAALTVWTAGGELTRTNTAADEGKR